MTGVQTQPVGNLLRKWRERRRLSQLDLACEAEISTRHLSFLETGRSLPSREMVLRLAEQLDVPLRERNTLLVAAGYAPAFPERPLYDPALQSARRSEEHTSELQSRENLVCRLLLEKKKKNIKQIFFSKKKKK